MTFLHTFFGVGSSVAVVAFCQACSPSGGGASDAGAPGDAAPIEGGDARPISSVPMLHRPVAAPCTQPRPAGTPGPTNCGGPTSGFFDGGCAADVDCAGGSNGRCNCSPVGATNNYDNVCTYDQCASDHDCGGSVCVCRDAPLRGVPWETGHDVPDVCFGGNCAIDSDCGAGGYCSPSPTPGCGATWWLGYYCHTAADECINDSDCTQGNAYCAYSSGAGHWICSTGMCEDG